MLLKTVLLSRSLHLIILIDGFFADPEKIPELATKASFLTVEIEHGVDVTALEQAQKSNEGKDHPSPTTTQIIQDKFRQKQHLSCLRLYSSMLLGR